MSNGTARLFGRTAVVAVIAGIAVSALTPTAASARFYRHWGPGAAIGAAIGTGLAIAAASNAYAYDYGPAYYGGPVYGGPVYGGPVYGGPVYYGGPYYYGRNYPHQRLYVGNNPREYW